MNTEVHDEVQAVEGPSRSRGWRAKLQVVGSSKVLIWLGLTCLFAALPLYYIRHAHLADPDIWWHMRTGEWIVQHHAIPRVDPFSAASMGRPWVDYSWIFDLCSYWLIAHFDLISIIWFENLMRVAVAVALFSLLRSLMLGFWKSVGLTGVAMLAMSWVFPPRPGAFSVLFFVLELYLILPAKRKLDTRKMWLLPVLFAVWANLHVEFVTGLFLLGVLCIEPFAQELLGSERRLDPVVDNYHRQLWYVFFASLAAMMVNPYGPNLLITVLKYARDTRIYDVIIEFQAMHFRTYNDWAVLALLMLGCFALGRIRPFRPAWAVLMGWAAWMSFRSLREVWLVAILSVVVVATSQSEEARGEEAQSGKEKTAEKNIRIEPSMRLAVGAGVMVALLAAATLWPLSSQRLLRQVAATYPVSAVNFIHQNHLQGPILNELSWGGFLIYAAPEMPVAMDGRTNVHTQDEILRAMPLWDGEPGWQNRPELQHANLVITSHVWPLSVLLRSDPRFRLAYEDDTAVLFEAVHAEKSDNQAVSHRP